jgi:hypothetical protein
MNGGTTLHPKLCARLAALVLSSRCLLVVSSSWRKEPEYMSAFLSKIQSLNVTAPFLAGQTGVIDHVPIMGMMRQLGMFVGDARRDALTCARFQRAQEIQVGTPPPPPSLRPSLTRHRLTCARRTPGTREGG